MWLVQEDQFGYRVYIDEYEPSDWAEEVWRLITHGRRYPGEGAWGKLPKPVYLVLPTRQAERIGHFTGFRVIFADPEAIYLTSQPPSQGGHSVVDWLGTATRRSYVVLWDVTHQYLLLERLPDRQMTYHLPGGHVGHHESAVEGAVREVKEELHYDLDPKRLRPLTVIEHHPYPVQAPFDQYQVLFYYEYETDLDVHGTTLTGDQEEVAGLLWARPSDLATLTLSTPLSFLNELWTAK